MNCTGRVEREKRKGRRNEKRKIDVFPLSKPPSLRFSCSPKNGTRNTKSDPVYLLFSVGTYSTNRRSKSGFLIYYRKERAEKGKKKKKSGKKREQRVGDESKNVFFFHFPSLQHEPAGFVLQQSTPESAAVFRVVVAGMEDFTAGTVSTLGGGAWGGLGTTEARRRPRRQQLPAGLVAQQSAGASVEVEAAGPSVATDARRLPRRQHEPAGSALQQSYAGAVEAVAAIAVAVVAVVAVAVFVVVRGFDGGGGKRSGVEASLLPILQQELAG